MQTEEQSSDSSDDLEHEMGSVNWKQNQTKYLKDTQMLHLVKQFMEYILVIKDTLENRGVLGQIKARIRAEVYNSLDDTSDSKPPLSNENMMINELIREYLEFNKYKYTASVLVSESGQPKQPLDRAFLAEELNVEEDRNSTQVPLLYSLIGQFMNKNRGKSTKSAMQNRGQSSRFLDDLEHEMASGGINHITEPLVDLAIAIGEETAPEGRGGRLQCVLVVRAQFVQCVHVRWNVQEISAMGVRTLVDIVDLFNTAVGGVARSVTQQHAHMHCFTQTIIVNLVKTRVFGRLGNAVSPPVKELNVDIIKYIEETLKMNDKAIM
ncbi:CEP20-like protein [Mya arenaria]|uniref:CEP20-like protein n=1 Tax=Mya arenaria TaxID=6604 RepID=A0ABY7DJ78_MYAAR|nr:CEP20-like protein [Mya arenaria]